MEPKRSPRWESNATLSSFAVERWMRLPGLPTTVPTTPVTELFVFSGYADFTGGSEDSSDIDGPVEGNGFADSALQTQWLEYDIEEMVVGPYWRRIDGVCPTVVIGGHFQLSPDVADGMGFRVQGISNVDTVTVASGAKRFRLSVNVAVRGGLDGRILYAGLPGHSVGASLRTVRDRRGVLRRIVRPVIEFLRNEIAPCDLVPGGQQYQARELPLHDRGVHRHPPAPPSEWVCSSCTTTSDMAGSSIASTRCSRRLSDRRTRSSSTCPSRSTISPDDVMFDEFTMMFAGGTRPMKEAFRRHPEYWLRRAITWLMRRHESPRPCP